MKLLYDAKKELVKEASKNPKAFEVVKDDVKFWKKLISPTEKCIKAGGNLEVSFI